ncbi:hypothetical protein V6N13_032354 [Hibiscus sabdariffa]
MQIMLLLRGGIGRDIPGFTVGSNDGTDEETYSEAETESIHNGLVESILDMFPNDDSRIKGQANTHHDGDDQKQAHDKNCCQERGY